MGATKRVAEYVCAAHNDKGNFGFLILDFGLKETEIKDN